MYLTFAELQKAFVQSAASGDLAIALTEASKPSSNEQTEPPAVLVEEASKEEMSPAAAAAVTTTTKTKVETSVTVKGVNLDDLSEEDQTMMKGDFQDTVAMAAGVLKDKVTIILVAGSIIVKAVIEVDDPSQATAITKAMAKPEAIAALTVTAKVSLELNKALEAKGKTMDDLEVDDLVVTARTPDTEAKPPAAESAARPTSKAIIAEEDTVDYRAQTPGRRRSMAARNVSLSRIPTWANTPHKFTSSGRQ